MLESLAKIQGSGQLTGGGGDRGSDDNRLHHGWECRTIVGSTKLVFPAGFGRLRALAQGSTLPRSPNELL